MKTLLIFLISLFSILPAVAVETEVLTDPRMMELIKTAPSSSDYPGVAGVYLLMEEVDTVNEDGSATYEMHAIYKILDKQGIAMGEVSIPFNSDEATMEISLARTITSDNTVVNISKDAIKELSPYSGLPLYNNMKVMSLSMPAVDVGSIIEYRAVLKVNRPKMPGFFYTYWSFPPGLPIKKAALDIIAPKGMKINYISRNFDVMPTINEKGDKKTYAWSVRDIFIEGVFDPFLPPYDTVCPNMIVASSKTWGEIAKWFNEISNPKSEPEQGMKDFVADIVQSEGGDKDKIMRDLYNFVSQKIKYVSIPIKSSGYEPHNVNDIYVNRYGDCKDKSALLISLYKLAGIESHFALLKMRNEGPLIKEFPALDFNHCIVAIPKEGGGYTFLDPTAELSRFGSMPVNLRDVDIFIVKKDGYEFVRLPQDTENISTIDMEINLKIGADNTIEADEKDTFIGDIETGARLNVKYSSPDAMRAYLSSMLQSSYTRPVLINYEASNPDNFDENFWVKIKYNVLDDLKEAGSLLIFDPPHVAGLMLNTAISTETRTHPIFFSDFTRESAAITITIPPGYKFNYLLKDIKRDSPFGYYERRVTSSDNMALINYYYKSKVLEIPVSEYLAFKAFAVDVLKSVRENVILEKGEKI